MKTSSLAKKPFKTKSFDEIIKLKNLQKIKKLKQITQDKKQKVKLRKEKTKEKAKEKRENNHTTLQNKIWVECRRIIRKKYQTEDGLAYCYTCYKPLPNAKDQQTGHMIPKAVCPPHMKYNLHNLRIQCYGCNINHGGMGAVFIENMRKIEGHKYVNNIKDQCFKAIYYKKVDAEYYKKLLEKYKNM